MPLSSILVVDDDPVIRRFVSANFQARFFNVLIADNGESALQIVRQNRPDLVILDIMMPGIDGIQVCHHIRKQSTVPILIISAKDDMPSKLTALKLGADDYMTKPFVLEELLARVDTLLRRSGNGDLYESPRKSVAATNNNK
ncbi:MAG: response regulator transcription factor [Planctomycetes bacterium]|nr:response regulator transcription factor [Planctomycetota bacterium]